MTGAEVRALRHRLGLTQEQMARALTVTFSTINRWENGHARPSALALRALQGMRERLEPEGGSGHGDG